MSAYPPPNPQLPNIFNPDEFYGEIPQQSGGGSQTPWLSNIDANGYSLITQTGSSQSITIAPDADFNVLLGLTDTAKITIGPTDQLVVSGTGVGIGGAPINEFSVYGTAQVQQLFSESLNIIATDTQITGSGEIGIKTTPVYDLDVSGNLRTKQIIDNTLSAGSDGQVLSKSGGFLQWIAQTARQGIAVNVNSTIALNGTAGTANLLPIGANSTVILNNGFIYDTVNNRVIYTGVNTTYFMVQTSIALRNNTAAIHSMGLELRRSTTPISQARYYLASSAFYDAQDFNIIQMNSGDDVQWYYSASINTMSLEAISQAGLTGSTTKPFQLLMWEIPF